MKTLSTLLLCACAWLASAASAAPVPAEAVLEDLRLRGYASPLAAIARLRIAGVPPADAPVDLRRRYHAALAAQASQASNTRLAEASLAELAQMAQRERCAPCGAAGEMVRARIALNRLEFDQADRHLAAAAPLVGADRGQQLRLRYLRARLHDVRGRFSRAMAEAVPALALADELGNTADAIEIMVLMVGLNADLGDHKRAEKIGHEAYALAARHHFTWMMGYARLQQGYSYALAGRTQAQVEVLRDALHIAGNDPGLAEVRVISLANLADYHLGVGEFDAALRYATEAEATARRLDDDNSRAVAIANMGIAISQLGDHARGIDKLEEAIVLSEKLGAKNYVVAMKEELTSAYERAGRPVDALASLRESVALSREITEQEREKTVLELQEKYAAERRSREIEQLTAANNLNRAEVAARTWQQRLWAVLAVGLMLATVPLMQWLRRVRRANRKLSGDIAVLAEQSVHDALTGVFNRRHCQQLMGQHQAQLQRADGHDYQAGVGLMVLDVDFFKRVNDTWGHAAGDRVLVEIARRLRGLVRQQDAVVRWGGEEFVLVLPGTPAQGLAGLAERVLHAIADQPVELGGHAIPVSVSIGCASFPLLATAQWEDSLHVADLALYLSKAGGRNRATCVVEVLPGADAERVTRDLAAAHAAGDVRLEIVSGPPLARIAAVA